MLNAFSASTRMTASDVSFSKMFFIAWMAASAPPFSPVDTWKLEKKITMEKVVRKLEIVLMKLRMIAKKQRRP